MKGNRIDRLLRLVLWCAVLFALVSLTGTAFAETLSFPANLEIIDEEAFFADSSLKTVILPEGLKRIESRAFADCTIESVYFPSSLEFIAEDAFDGCNAFYTYVEKDCEAYQYLLAHHMLNQPLPEGVTMRQNENGSYTVSGFSGSCVNLKLPDYYLGYPVVEIATDAFREADISGTLTLPSTLEKIGNNAFMNCDQLTGELYIPDSVTYIAEQAFRECKNFTGLRLSPNLEILEGGIFYGCSGFTGELILPPNLREIRESWVGWIGVEHVGTFEGCTGFTGSLVIPDSVTRIGLRVFQDCSGFNGTLHLSSSLKYIGENAFLRCSNLTGSLIIPDTVTTMGKHAFYRCSGMNGELQLSSNMTTIPWGAFYRCEGLTGELNIPYGITYIDGAAFFNCTGFTSLVLPETLVSLGDSPFQGCTGFTGELRLPQSLTSIENGTGDSWNNFDKRNVNMNGAFNGCSGFTSLILPEGITNIGKGAFSDCSGLKGDLIIPDSVESVGANAFANCGFDGCLQLSPTIQVYGSSAFGGCSQFTGSLVIPDCVTSIDEYTFAGCSGFSALVLSDSLTSIGSRAFQGCSGFQGTLEIPSSVEIINREAFNGCSGLEKLNLHEGLTTIATRAFYGCSGLTGDLWFPDSVTTIGWAAFSMCENLGDTIYFGTGLTSLGANWIWSTATAGVVTGATINRVIFASDHVTYIDSHAIFNNIDICCNPDSETAQLLASSNIPYRPLGDETMSISDTFKNLRFLPSSTIVNPGKPFYISLNNIILTELIEYRYEFWNEDVLVQVQDWHKYALNQFVLNEEGEYTIKGFARVGTYCIELGQESILCNSFISLELLSKTVVDRAITLNIRLTIEENNDIFLSNPYIYLETSEALENWGWEWDPEHTTHMDNDGGYGVILTDLCNKKGTSDVTIIINASVISIKPEIINICVLSEGDSWFSGIKLPIVIDMVGENVTPIVEDLSIVSQFDNAFKTSATNTAIDHVLANISVEACVKTYDDNGLYETLKYLEQLGFEYFEFDDLFSGEHTAAHFIGCKTILDENNQQIPLFAVVIRGTNGTYKEWRSNFTPGNGTIHAGFSMATDRIRNTLSQCIDTYYEKKGMTNTGNYKLWITGHSRGAACGNILAATYTGTSAENIYAYLFATPNVTKAPIQMNNIKNFVFQNDLIPRMPPTQYGYDKYGITYYINSDGEILNNKPLATGNDLDLLINIVYDIFPSLDDLIDKLDYVFDHLNENSQDLFSAESLDWKTGFLIIDMTAQIVLSPSDPFLPAKVISIIPNEANCSITMLQALEEGYDFDFSRLRNTFNAHFPQAYRDWIQTYLPANF